MKDFYYILGIANKATPPEIEGAYQKLASKFYRDGEGPDEFMDNHFLEIAEAYDVLRDTTRRRKYDTALRLNEKRHLAIFRLKYLNIAVTITFLIVTALFTDYVISSIRGRPAKKAAPKVSVQLPVAITVHPKKHSQLAATVLKHHVPVVDTVHHQPARVVPAAVPPPVVDSTYKTTLHANITGIVYLHQSADYSSAVLAKIPHAAEIRVLQKGSVYYKVMFDGQTGYVLKSTVGKP
jgi:putative alpha-1,2-mannosidase